MSVEQYTIGQDFSVVYIGPNGRPLRFAERTGFTWKPQTTARAVDKSDGERDNLAMIVGWEGSIDYERAGNEIDAYFADEEAKFRRGENIRNGVLQITIREKDGSVSQYRLNKVSMRYEEAGGGGGTDTMKQKLAWAASSRERLV